MVDKAKAGTANDIRRQSEIDQIEGVEELRAKFQRDRLTAAAMPQSGIFDQREVVVRKPWPAKCVAPKRSKASLIRPRTAGHIQRNVEKRGIERP